MTGLSVIYWAINSLLSRSLCLDFKASKVGLLKLQMGFIRVLVHVIFVPNGQIKLSSKGPFSLYIPVLKLVLDAH